MEVGKKAYFLSVAALSLLLCPASVVAAVSYYVGITVFCIFCLKNNIPSQTININFKQLIVSFLITLLVFGVFVIRWSNAVDAVVLALIGLVLCILATPSFSFFVNCLGCSKHINKLEDKKLHLTDHFILLLFATVIMLVVSSASFLVPVNWDYDSNCIYTAARGLTHGKLIYRDLIEHKGVILHLIFSAGALITPYKYTGLWLVETLFCYLFLVVSTKIQCLFVKNKSVLNAVVSGAAGVLLYGSRAFNYGNTAEEYSVLFIALILYLGLLTIVNDDVRFSRFFVIGVLTAVVFWIKYNLCGSVLGIMLFVLGYMVVRKDHKTVLRIIGGVAAGFMTITVPILLYYYIRGGLQDLVNVYFVMNIFKYNIRPEAESLMYSLIRPYLALFGHLAGNNNMLILLIIGAVFLYCSNKKVFIMVTTALVFGSFFAFMGIENYSYYPFILTPFAVFGVIPVSYMIAALVRGRKGIMKMSVVVATVVLSFMGAFTYINNIKCFSIPREDYPSYTFEKIIEEADDKSFICFDFIDCGFYTYMGVDPEVPYYSFLNADSSHITQEQLGYINEGDYNFIITTNGAMDFDGYELVSVQKDPIKDGVYFLLYQRSV